MLFSQGIGPSRSEGEKKPTSLGFLPGFNQSAGNRSFLTIPHTFPPLSHFSLFPHSLLFFISTCSVDGPFVVPASFNAARPVFRRLPTPSFVPVTRQAAAVASIAADEALRRRFTFSHSPGSLNILAGNYPASLSA
jgi:hypothetical protein